MNRHIAITLTLLVVGAGTLQAQEKRAAVLLLPESDMDRELADDLTEVLISSLLDHSGRAYRIEGKESFRTAMDKLRTKTNQECLREPDCIRQEGGKLGLELLLVGRVGRAANGYRLEVWSISPAGRPEPKPYRKGIDGDVGKLIEEMETVAAWALRPPESSLTISVVPVGAAVKLDGQPVAKLDQPLPVAPGKHTVTATAADHEEGKLDVECRVDEPCTASLKLTPRKVVKPVEPPKDQPPVKPESGRALSTTTIVATSVLAGAALLAGGGSAYLYVQMKNCQDDADFVIDKLCPNGKSCSVTEKEFFRILDPVVEDGEANALWANVLGGVAGAAALAATTVLLIDLFDGPEPTGAPARSAFLPLLIPGAPAGCAFELRF